MPQGTSEDLFAWDVASGPLGSIDAIPAGFSLTYVLSFGDAGINNAMRRWGDVLLKAHAKQRGGAEADFTAQYLLHDPTPSTCSCLVCMVIYMVPVEQVSRFQY